MRRAALVIVFALLAVLACGSAAPTASPSSGAAVMQSVIVTLRDQADLRGVRGPRKSRKRQVVAALRVKADKTQRQLRLLLTLRRAQGKVAAFDPLWVFNGLAVTATDDVVEELRRRPEVKSIAPDESIQGTAGAATAALAEPGIARVLAPEVWALGARGQGVVVATMDSGVDLNQPELAARWRGGNNSWYDPSGEHASPFDASGHGTSTLGVIVGGSGGGTSVGVAPDARWIAVKIFNDRGTAAVSRIHQGFQWLLDPDHDPQTADAPDVVNNSWSYSSPGCNLEFQRDLQNLRAAGILPIFAAGNTGPLPGSSVSPSNYPEAFAVGATSSTDGIASFSARGPSACGEASTVFPEIVAPGVNVRTTDRFGGYTTVSGTSFAAPTAAGAVALLLSAYPELTVSQQEAALKNAVDLGATGPDNSFGYGRLDALGAYASISPPAPDFLVGASPNSADVLPGATTSFTVDVSAVGGFAGNVALAVAGLAPAQGSWAFTPATITGGAGSSQLSVTVSPSLTPGTYPLTITATSGTLQHTAAISLVVTPAPVPDYTLGVSPASATTTPGGTSSYTVTAAPLNGFAADVALSISGVPAGAASSFSPAAIAGGSGSSQLTLTTSAATAPGTYGLTITGTGGSTMHTASATLVVNPLPDFAIAAAPPSAATTAGGSTAYTITITALNGFAGSVSLSVTGLPAASSGAFAPPSVAGAGSSQLTVTTTLPTPPGSYPLTITGASGALAHSASTTLVVTAPALTQTAFPATTTILTGSLRSGSALALNADDGLSYSVNAGVSGLQLVAAWYGTFTGVPNSATSLKVTYKGKNSVTCTQTVSVWNWTTGLWTQLDSRTVGNVDVQVADLAPPGPPADFVSGATGSGDLRVRVHCAGGFFGFYSSGNLMKLTYGQ